MPKTVQWSRLLAVANKYAEEAEACAEAGIPIAGLVSVRAALEAVLAALFLLYILHDASDDEVAQWGFKRDQATELLTYSGQMNIWEMTDALNSYATRGWISKDAYNAAERIRKWGNLIHAENLATTRFPSVRNLEARIKDLQLVSGELIKLI